MLDIKQTSETRIIPENHSWATKLQPVWDELRDLPLFEEIATIDPSPDQDSPLANSHQSHPGTNGHQDLPSANGHAALNGSVPRPESEDVDFEPYLGKREYLAPGSSDPQGENQSPKILPKAIVRFRAQDERWPIIAAVDEQGSTCPADHFVIRSRGDLPVEVLAALLNSPVTNAYLSIHQVKVENFLALLQKVPVPRLKGRPILDMESWVREYRAIRDEWLPNPVQIGPVGRSGKGLFRSLESELLGFYRLSMSTERALQAYFAGYRRPGPFPLIPIEASPQNMMYGTIISVEDIRNQGDEKVIEAYVHGWSTSYPHELVHFPLTLVPPEIRGKITKDATLSAKINIGARSAKDLVFEDLELEQLMTDEEFYALIT